MIVAAYTGKALAAPRPEGPDDRSLARIIHEGAMRCETRRRRPLWVGGLSLASAETVCPMRAAKHWRTLGHPSVDNGKTSGSVEARTRVA